ncbi:MAG: galactokinase [Desulfobacterales bacterium]|nr:galactokinase [Desulfobacterales bacterium]
MNMGKIRKIIEKNNFEASAPCRIDMGGTLDISTFYLPLRHLSPYTINMAVNLRTQVKVKPYDAEKIKISSRGFRSAVFHHEKVPFNHPLGFMFAIAAYFGVKGIHIDIDSASPPKSALGGSSVAAVALIALLSGVFEKTGEKPLTKPEIAQLAWRLECAVTGSNCGIQDQLAAVYGGINSWYWNGDKNTVYSRKAIAVKKDYKRLEPHFLLAYCGVPHESLSVNGTWIRQFLDGKYRKAWAEIIECTKRYAGAITSGDYKLAVEAVNREVTIRRRMTPDVLDSIGKKLVDAAKRKKCGARFTGAGAGGCLWAIGEKEDIIGLKESWERILTKRKDARLLDVKFDGNGAMVSGF